MQFHGLIYFDPRAVFGGSAEAQAMLAEIGPHTAALQASGHLVSAIPLNLPQSAVTVQSRSGETLVTNGPFAEATEVLGGIVVIEAADRDEAIRIAATMPHAKLGHIEIRPAIDYTQPRPKF